MAKEIINASAKLQSLLRGLKCQNLADLYERGNVASYGKLGKRYVIAVNEKLAAKDIELGLWQRYAAFCRCCALSGENDPYTFEQFCQAETDAIDNLI